MKPKIPEADVQWLLRQLPRPIQAPARVRSPLALAITHELRSSLKTVDSQLVRLKIAAHSDQDLKWMTDAERLKLKRQLMTAVNDLRAELRRRQ
jgi:hypothetical protein